MIVGSCRSSTFILVMDVNISIYFLSWRLMRYDRVNSALLYYWLISAIVFCFSRICLCLFRVF